MNTSQQQYYQQICSIAQSKGGIIMSDRYINTNTHITVQCQYGHQWEVTPSRLKIGRWCPDCAGNGSREAERRFIEAVVSKGGKINGKYIKSTVKVQLECRYGHKWETTPHIINIGSWCPICAGKDSKNAEQEFYQIVSMKGGKVHGQYINCKTKVEIKFFFGCPRV